MAAREWPGFQPEHPRLRQCASGGKGPAKHEKGSCALPPNRYAFAMVTGTATVGVTGADRGGKCAGYQLRCWGEEVM